LKDAVTKQDIKLESAYYHAANRNKKSVTVDMGKPEGQDLLHRIARESDVVVENFQVGKLDKYRLSYQHLSKINPRLVYASITGFGQTGPRKMEAGYDFALQGMGGLMSITGEPDSKPTKVGVAIVDMLTGMYTTTAILAALESRRETGGM